jgi:predicted nucleic acid-binding protein
VSSSGQIVSDTGPLISLEKLANGYRFIRQLYDIVIVPTDVLAEVAEGSFGTPQAYLQHYAITDLIDVRSVSVQHPLLQSGRLHAGESQAIQLALNLGLPLLIEETFGRMIAQRLGIHISGIAGQILKVYRQGLIRSTDAHHMLDEMLLTGRINQKIHASLIKEI